MIEGEELAVKDRQAKAEERCALFFERAGEEDVILMKRLITLYRPHLSSNLRDLEAAYDKAIRKPRVTFSP
jgi:hypothetical protein